MRRGEGSLGPCTQHPSGLTSCGLQVLEEAGVRSLVEHHAEMSQIALPQLLKEGRQFDLGFVDGNHRFDSVFVDLSSGA